MVCTSWQGQQVYPPWTPPRLSHQGHLSVPNLAHPSELPAGPQTDSPNHAHLQNAQVCEKRVCPGELLSGTEVESNELQVYEDARLHYAQQDDEHG